MRAFFAVHSRFPASGLRYRAKDHNVARHLNASARRVRVESSLTPAYWRTWDDDRYGTHHAVSATTVEHRIVPGWWRIIV